MPAMGVPASTPSAPTLLTVAVAPASSFGVTVRSRAALARRRISADSSGTERAWAPRTTGTISPSGVSTATPMS